MSKIGNMLRDLDRRLRGRLEAIDHTLLSTAAELIDEHQRRCNPPSLPLNLDEWELWRSTGDLKIDGLKDKGGVWLVALADGAAIWARRRDGQSNS